MLGKGLKALVCSFFVVAISLLSQTSLYANDKGNPAIIPATIEGFKGKHIFSVPKTSAGVPLPGKSIESYSSIGDWKLYKEPTSLSSQHFGQATGIWLTNTYYEKDRIKRVMADAKGKAPIFVLYFTPSKNHASYVPTSSEINDYLAYNMKIAEEIGSQKAIVIVEPDTLSLCANKPDALFINQEITKRVVQIYKAYAPQTKVYLDAGHSNWHSAFKMSKILRQAGIAQADGFVSNVSNFRKTADELAYAKELSSYVGNKNFIVDTSRNGLGPGGSRNGAPVWSDPVNVATGHIPTTITSTPGLDAFLWVKPPGEADGSYAPAGSWHPELVQK